MQEERKSIGGALVDVFDAAVTLVKAEIRAVARQVGEVAKAKGVGVVLLLASVGPLVMGLVFLILAVFYLLMRLGLGAWVAALIIALLGFALTGVLVMLGLRRLSAELPRDPEERRVLTEDDHLEAQYRAEQAATTTAAPSAARVTVASATTMTGSDGAHPARSAGDYRVPAVATDQVEGHVTRPMALSEEGRTVTIPVYGTNPDGSQPAHGGSVTDFGVTPPEDERGHSPQRGHGGHAGHDPNVQHPVVLKDHPGISVSTEPTFREDMKKEGY
ncbi:phage holin family protein [Deinococcus sp. YIM 77859]|uniref:phage holin family protein n=1 Tax=Deinococcus sp. YIM 77859 TaxID=1540221 RepID=UPI0005501F68|nr:phage holin family protein [Deinococcus sp. YIM 77859]